MRTVDEALSTARFLGYPVLVRPSYVLGGMAMEIVHNEAELTRFVEFAASLESKKVILIDKYFEGKEVEVDAVADGEEVLIPGIMEHIERAGVHSGDSIAVYPGINLTPKEVETIVDYTTRIGLSLRVKGLMNIQYVIMRDKEAPDSTVYVLEVNPRASRTVPFISKVTGVPLVKLATKVMLGHSLKEQGYRGGLWRKQRLFGIKAPVFSMSKLPGVDTYLSPEMKSTGEVLGIDLSFEAALTKALLSSGLAFPAKSAILISIADRDKSESVPLIRRLFDLKYKLYATEGTSKLVRDLGLPVTLITKKLGEGHPNVVDVILNGEVGAVINTITGGRTPLKDGFQIRRAAAERRLPCFTSLDTARVAIEALANGTGSYSIKPLNEYLKEASLEPK